MADAAAAASALLDVSTVEGAPGRAWALEWTARVDRALSLLLEEAMTGAAEREDCRAELPP